MKALAHVKPALTKTDSDPKLRRDSVSEASVEDIQDISNKNPWININWGKVLRYTSLVLLILQYSSHVLMTRYVTTRENQPKFLRTVAVFVNEVMKLLAAFVFYYFSVGSIKEFGKGMYKHFIVGWMDTLKVAVPALIYTIQNFLLYIGVENLDVGTHMVTYQLRILTTAFFTVIMLKRRLSVVQWISLLVLTGGVALVQFSAEQKDSKPLQPMLLNNMTDSFNSTDLSFNASDLQQLSKPAPLTKKTEQNPLIGFLAVLTACVLSGFAGIWFEKILKGSTVSLWMRNIQLAGLALPISVIMMGFVDGSGIASKGMFVGFDWMVWLTVALQAYGGILVAIVIKYADNILKAFASSLAIILSTIAAIFIFSSMPKYLFIFGAFLVIGSLVLYSAFPHRKTTVNDESDDSDEGDSDSSVVDLEVAEEIPVDEESRKSFETSGALKV